MKKLLFALLGAAAISFAFKPVAELQIGAALPKSDVQLEDVSGKIITLQKSLDKNGLLVMFSCNTCPYVIKNQARAREVLSYAKSQHIGVVVLNSNEGNRSGADSYDAMKTYAKEQGYTWSYAVDKNNEIADAFGASRTPECYLFNSDGKLVYHGAIDDSPADAGAVERKHIHAAIDDVLAGREVSVKTSKSVGCGIKRKV